MNRQAIFGVVNNGCVPNQLVYRQYGNNIPSTSILFQVAINTRESTDSLSPASPVLAHQANSKEWVGPGQQGHASHSTSSPHPYRLPLLRLTFRSQVVMLTVGNDVRQVVRWERF